MMVQVSENTYVDPLQITHITVESVTAVTVWLTSGRRIDVQGFKSGDSQKVVKSILRAMAKVRNYGTLCTPIDYYPAEGAT